MGILLERTGVCSELYHKYPNLVEIVNERIEEMRMIKEVEGTCYEPFTTNISPTTKQVLEIASDRMKHFKQVYINEGHLLDAIFRVNDQATNNIVEGLDVSSILEIVAYPRDMIVSLKEYSFPTLPSTNIVYKRAEQSDAVSLRSFVEKEFGNGWLDSIENGLVNGEIPIFIALDEEQIVGFACFDVVRGTKGLFGPMGTSFSNRLKGIGYTLLHICLQGMTEKGYEYAVIGEAGPIEFYEKACDAVVIPR